MACLPYIGSFTFYFMLNRSILPPMACKLMNYLYFLCGYLYFISCLGEGERGLKGERMAGGRAEILLGSNGNTLN